MGKYCNYPLTTTQCDRFASCENIVSRSQTSSSPPPPWLWHTKVKCSKAPCTDIDACKIKEKHPEHKPKISQLQREIRSLENKAQEEEDDLKSFTAAHERAKSSFFYVMRPRLKRQNQVKYSNRRRLDREIL